MNEELFNVSILNENLRCPSTSSNNSTSDFRNCPSTSTCDSGIYSNCDILHSRSEPIHVDETVSVIYNENYKVNSEQEIRKLKNELQYLQNSIHWYKNELKSQKTSRFNTLEKLYLNERDFLKNNQALEQECRRLRVLCDQSKLKINQKKEILVEHKKTDDVSFDKLSNNINDNEVFKYQFQKLKKIIEEHEALIDVLRKQKHNLLKDLQSLTTEKDSKITFLEKKCLTLVKENCMIVDKCKNLIVEKKPPNDSNIVESNTSIIIKKDYEIKTLRNLLSVKEEEIKRLKCQIDITKLKTFKLDENVMDYESVINKKNHEIELNKIIQDSQKKNILHLQTKILKLNEVKENILSSHSYAIEQTNKNLKIKECQVVHVNDQIKNKETQIVNLKRNLSEVNEKYNNLANDCALLVYEILNINELQLSRSYSISKENNLEIKEIISKFRANKSSFLMNYSELLRNSFVIIKCFKGTLIDLDKDCMKLTVNNNCNLLSLIEEIINIFNENTIVAKVVFTENSLEELGSERCIFDVKETIRKNTILHNVLLQKLHKSLKNNFTKQKLEDSLNHYNDFVKNINTASCTKFNNTNGSQILEDKQLVQDDKKSSKEILQDNIILKNFNDFNELKTLLLSQQAQYETKISRHQAHIRLLLSNIKIWKNKFEKSNNKYENLENKIQNLKNELMKKDENEKTLCGEIILLKSEIEKIQENNSKRTNEVKNLQCVLKAAETQFNEIGAHEKIIKMQNNVFKLEKQKINYDDIYELINKSNNCVPSLKNVCQSVDDIKSDIKILMMKKISIFQHNKNNNLMHGKKLRMFSRTNENKSLLDELKEASAIS